MIPLIILNFNQLYYLKNLIDWWGFHVGGPIIVSDNASTYVPLLDYYKRLKGFKVWEHEKNMCWENLKRVVEEVEKEYEYYVIAPSDIVPTPGTPENFLDIFKYLIEHEGFHHVGFTLKIDDLPEYIGNTELILRNEVGFWQRPMKFVYEGRVLTAYRAPLDATFCLYKSSDGWSQPMDGKKWNLGGRLFEAYHLPWYQHPGYVNEEMDNYFKTCKKRVDNSPSTGGNNYRPKQYE